MVMLRKDRDSRVGSPCFSGTLPSLVLLKEGLHTFHRGVLWVVRTVVSRLIIACAAWFPVARTSW